MSPWQPWYNMSPKLWTLKYAQLPSFPVNIGVTSSIISTTEQKPKKINILWYFFQTIQHTGNILCIQFSMVGVKMCFTVHQNYETELIQPNTKTWIWSVRSNLSDLFSRLGKVIVTSRWYIICYLIPLLHHLAYKSSPGL
jgi:hypothetical protein